MDQLWDTFSETATSCHLLSSQGALSDPSEGTLNNPKMIRRKTLPKSMTQMVAVTLKLLRWKVANQKVLQLTKRKKRKKLKKEDVPLTEDLSDQGETVTKPKKKKSKQKSKNVLESRLAAESVELPKADRLREERDAVMA